MRGKSKATLVILDAAYEILDEIQPATVRAVCYQLFIRELIPDMSKGSTNKVSRHLRLAREEGFIPWHWITDESREAERANTWSSGAALIAASVQQYRRDYWQHQPQRVEVWSEKGTIRGSIAPVLDEYGVTFRVMHGYASATVVNDIANMSRRDSRPLTALYIGDHDPSGLHMSEYDLPRRLDDYGADLTLERIALTDSDLPGLPSFDPQSKKTDPRFKWFQKHYPASKCYELDAMKPNLLRDRVAAAILGRIDEARWSRAIEVEKVEVESMREFHSQFRKVLSRKQIEAGLNLRGEV